MIDFRKTIGVWGDSVLKGVVLDDDAGTYQVLPDGCAQQMADHYGLTILNKSRFGSTIAKGQQLLTRSLASGLDCSAILLEYGGNDCDFDWPAVARQPELDHQPHTTLSDFRAILRQMIVQLRSQQITPILMSLPPISGSRYLSFITSKGLDRDRLLAFLGDEQQIYRFHESYSLAITRIAAETGSLYIPIREAFLARRDSPKLLCADGIHPNHEGHELMLQVFGDLLQRWRLGQPLELAAV
jgi:acyl-CoA thioesterase-1